MSDAEQPGTGAVGGEHVDHDHGVEGPGYATPQAAIEESDPEEVAYVMGLYVGTDVDAPDFLAVVDVDPDSADYGEVVDRVEMPNRGDELHHFGWNACSSSCHIDGLERRNLLVPGQRSSRIHVVDTVERRSPELAEVIEPAEVFEQDLSAPHTVHCIPDGEILISMLGDENGYLPGGFLSVNDEFEVRGRWDPPGEIEMNYDFWYQPRQNVMISTEWAAPKTYYPGFDLEDVEAGNYGRQLHVWDWEAGTVEQTIDLGEEGQIPLEVRFLHSPVSTHGFVGAALSSNVFHFYEDGGEYRAEKAIDVEARDHDDWDMPVPGLVTDLLVSMDDRYLFFSNWLHGDVRMYDVSDPANPRFVDRIWAGGHFGPRHPTGEDDRPVFGGPQMLQLSLDGERLYWTTSLFSLRDNQTNLCYPWPASRACMSEKYRAKLDGELDRWEQALADGHITRDTYDAAMGFRVHDESRDISVATVASHLLHLRKVAGAMDEPLTDADLTDVLAVLNQFRSGRHPAVKDDGIGVRNHQKALRVFYDYRDDLGVDPEDIELDEEEGRNLQPDDLLFREDVDALLKACYDDPRMRAYIAVALATGLRADALRTLRLRHVEEDGPTMTIRLNTEEAALKGASGSKALLWSKHYLREWLDVHPYAGDDDAAVFCAYPGAPHTDGTGDTMHDQTIRDHINRIADRADIGKNVYPHLFRHTAITRLALEDLNEQQIKQTVDWDGDSSQFSTYVTLADELTNDSVREKMGYPTTPGGTPIIGRPTLERCDECGDGFPEGAERCPTCGEPLTHRAAEDEAPEPDAEAAADPEDRLAAAIKDAVREGADPGDLPDLINSATQQAVEELQSDG